MPDLTTDNEQDNQDNQQQDNQQVDDKKPARSDNRFKDLSDKVELTAKERDEAAAKAAAAEKEVEFYKSFSKLKYPDALEYQEKIKEKVMAGYDMEDAAISVLAKAGKLNQMPPPVRRDSPAGGSATTAMRSGGEKSAGEMTQAERRQALLDSDMEEPGSLAKTLRGMNYGG